MPWTNPVQWNIGQATSPAQFNTQVLDNITYFSTHKHSGAAGDGGKLSGSQVGMIGYLQLSLLLPASYSGTVTYNTDDTGKAWYTTILTSASTTVDYPINIGGCVIKFTIRYTQRVDGACAQFLIDGASFWSLDTYNAAPQYTYAQTTGLGFACGTHTFRIKNLGTNSSATGGSFLDMISAEFQATAL